ncbi:MAG TPA: hypothetical protein DDZ83_11575 [Nitrospinae bacterium]|nr:hypothetical protein [Nitrospinota bacterium]
MMYRVGDFGASRIGILTAALRWTLLTALPAGLAGWAAASGLFFMSGIHTTRPLWFLLFWCLWFFCNALKHFSAQEKARSRKHFEERRNTAGENFGLAA